MTLSREHKRSLSKAMQTVGIDSAQQRTCPLCGRGGAQRKATTFLEYDHGDALIITARQCRWPDCEAWAYRVLNRETKERSSFVSEV